MLFTEGSTVSKEQAWPADWPDAPPRRHATGPEPARAGPHGGVELGPARGAAGAGRAPREGPANEAKPIKVQAVRTWLGFCLETCALGGRARPGGDGEHAAQGPGVPPRQRGREGAGRRCGDAQGHAGDAQGRAGDAPARCGGAQGRAGDAPARCGDALGRAGDRGDDGGGASLGPCWPVAFSKGGGGGWKPALGFPAERKDFVRSTRPCGRSRPRASQSR